MKLSRRHFMATAAAASVAPTVLSATPTAQAAAPMVGKQAPGFYRFKVGEFEVTTLNDGFFSVPEPAKWITNKTPDEINAVLDAGALPRTNVRIPVNPVVINTGKNLVLIDSGFGDNGPPILGGLTNNMAAAGIDPKTVDTVLLTHFHPDHTNGLRSKAGEANFPNAEIIVAAEEWKYWNDEGELSRAADAWKPSFATTKRVFGPVAKDVKQVAYGKEVVPGITAVDSRGHSPGHTSYLTSSGNSKMMVLGDVTNHPAIFARNPEFRLWADQIPDLALQNRRKLLDMASAERIRIVGYHYTFPANGYFVKQGNGYEFIAAHWDTAM